MDELHLMDQEHGKIIQVFEKKNKKDMKKVVRDHLTSVSGRITKSLQNDNDWMNMRIFDTKQNFPYLSYSAMILRYI